MSGRSIEDSENPDKTTRSDEKGIERETDGRKMEV
jgi:hypothetical protein